MFDATIETVLFYCFAAMILAGAFGVLLSRNIVRTAVWLLSTLAAAAGLYFLLGASFVGAVQLIVYAGGTLVLIIFGVMLTARDPKLRTQPTRLEVIAGGVVCVLLAAVLIGVFVGADWYHATGEPREIKANADRLTDLDAENHDGTANLGRLFLSTYLVPFEVISVLLLAVLIGSAYLARPRVPTATGSAPPARVEASDAGEGQAGQGGHA